MQIKAVQDMVSTLETTTIIGLFLLMFFLHCQEDICEIIFQNQKMLTFFLPNNVNDISRSKFYLFIV